MNHQKLHVFLLRGVLCLTACAADKSPTPPAAQWSRDGVAGLTMELIDPVTVKWMMFSAEGNVSVTIGRKNGPLTGPAFQWRLTQGRLQLYDGRQVFEELTLVSRDSSTIVVRRRNGQVAKYKILSK